MVRTIPSAIEGELRFPQEEESKTPQNYKIAAVGDLANGVNNGAILSAKIVMHLEKQQEVPMSYLVVDFKNNFFVASFYHTNKSLNDKIAVGDLIYLKNP